MTTLPQVPHERVVRALKRAGFYILRQGKHISMTDEKHIVIRRMWLPVCRLAAYP